MTPQIYPGLSPNTRLLINPTTAIKCDKPHCYFCYLMIGVKGEPIRHKYKEAVKRIRKAVWLHWTPGEDAIVLANINRFANFIDLPYRTINAIKVRKSYLRKLHNIPTPIRVRNQFGWC